LGVTQGAGYPLEKECCQRVYKNPLNKRFVSSIAIVDPISNESWIFDATPDLAEAVLQVDGNPTLNPFLWE